MRLLHFFSTAVKHVNLKIHLDKTTLHRCKKDSVFLAPLMVQYTGKLMTHHKTLAVNFTVNTP